MSGIRRFVWPALIAGFLLFSLAPTLYELSRAQDVPPERSFELVHNFPTDYNFYLSRIREGLEGRWTVVEKYTSEPHNGSLIHEMYLLMGRVGRMVNVPWGKSGDIYHVARTVLGLTLLVLVAEFCKKSWGDKPHWAVMGFLLAMTASSWPKLVAVVQNQVVTAAFSNISQWRFGGYMSWWSVMDSLQRITFVPHLLAGQALIVFLVMALTDAKVLKSGRNVVFLGILAFVLGMIFPPGLVFVYGTMGVFGVIQVVANKRMLWGMWMTWGAVVLISVSALVYLFLITSVYPWHRLTELDILHPLPFVYWEYFQAVGPMMPLGLMGLMVALFKRDKIMYPAVSWVIAWLGFLIIFHFVPQQSPLRFSEMIPQVPLGVLSAYLFFQASGVKYLRNLGRIAAILLITLGFLQMYSSYLWQKDFVDHKIRASWPLVPTGSYVMYPLKDFIAPMGVIWDMTKGQGIVLSETTAGNYLPAHAGSTVYVGHDNTVFAETKKAAVKDFFSGVMEPRVAKAWLMREGIRIIYYGPQERDDGGITNLDRVYPFLRSIYTNPYVTLYDMTP